MYKLYLAKRLNDKLDDFYLTPSQHWQATGNWFISSAMGINGIGAITNEIMKNTDSDGSNYTNHSLRRTAIKRLQENETTEQIQHRSGHKSTAGLLEYCGSNDNDFKRQQSTLYGKQI